MLKDDGIRLKGVLRTDEQTFVYVESLSRLKTFKFLNEKLTQEHVLGDRFSNDHTPCVNL